MGSYFVYIGVMGTGSYYVGYTQDIKRRVVEHCGGYGSQTTSFCGFEKIVYVEEFKTKQEAIQRERQLKKWSRQKKEALIKGDIKLLKKLSQFRGS
ncbi:MAG: GIY-YIG nuclease family protein [Bdellovibrionaceae bacterium]|nr:GIY-YIG nuclease family protein [Pseudobdellovibrionaceae bacterium]